MASGAWSWKGKDGSGGALRYEPGNWGDMLKLSWLGAFLSWCAGPGGAATARYVDPFAGAVEYPLEERVASRFGHSGLAELEFARRPFLERKAWPSAAAAARVLFPGPCTVFDIDDDRRNQWRAVGGVTVAEAESAWRLLADLRPRDGDVWLVDPYDYLAEWRAATPLLLEKAGTATVIVYLHNRSANNAEAFAAYRAFRNFLDGTAFRPLYCLGRAAADAFLPRAHHEMLLLPGSGVRNSPGWPALRDRLEKACVDLMRAQHRAAAFITA